MSCFCLQYYGSLDQLKSQCRDAGDCHHRPHNYDGTCAPASAAECSHTLASPLPDLQAIRRSQFPSSSPLQSDARAYVSVAEHERHVFVGDIRVTTFHTHP
jgi:hypothetical protein